MDLEIMRLKNRVEYLEQQIIIMQRQIEKLRAKSKT